MSLVDRVSWAGSCSEPALSKMEESALGQLFANLVPLALASAVNPAMMVFALGLLLSATRPLARAMAFLMGAATTSVVVGGVALLGIGNLSQFQRGRTPSVGESVFLLIAGILLLVAIGWDAWRRPSRAPTSNTAAPRREYQKSASSPLVAFVVGAGFMLSNVKALVPYVVGIKHIADAALGVVVSAVLVLGFIVTMLLGMEIPIVIYAADRQRAATLLAHMRAWMSAHARTLSIMVGLALGVYLIARGISGLVG
jgi:threonine/homoserine/homoserine lactone efflux protein